jgi:diadenosine tetraphosphatase ApaH/serine/threonine PP2A family protein phosphatase
MRIGILSDIHSNLAALERVLEDAESVDPAIDRYVCLGDVVGYGANPNECCEIIRDLCEFTIVGNHDAAVCGRMDYSFYYQQAREALDWHAEQVSEDQHAWLQSLPYRRDIDDVAYCHGAPVNEEDFEYVFTLQQANKLLDHWEDLAHVNFIGHSHLTKSFELDQKEGARELEGDVLDFEEGKKYIVTAGSVGQPRDNDNRACWGIFDPEARTFEFRRVGYDVRTAARRIFESELSSDFGKRLYFGI